MNDILCINMENLTAFHGIFEFVRSEFVHQIISGDKFP